MARTIVQISPAAFGSGIFTIDTANGNHFDLSVGGGPAGPGPGRMADAYPLHLFVNNTAGAGSATLKAGFGPWGNANADLSIAIGATQVVDIGPQIVRGYARDSFGSFDLDWVTVAGQAWLVWGNIALLPAGVAQAFQLKDSAGALLGAAITATGTAALSVYDSPSAALGTALLTLAPSAALGFYGATLPRPAATGLIAGGVVNAPAATIVYT